MLLASSCRLPTVQLGHSYPGYRLPGDGKERKLKMGKQIKVGWLIGGKVRRKHKDGRGYGSYQGRERGNNGEGKMRYPTQALKGASLVFLSYTAKFRIRF